MQGRIVRTYTSDNLNLQGMLCEPRAPTDDRRLVLHIHGSYGNFYENPFLDSEAAALTSTGAAFLSANTRGHDYYADFKMKRGGGGYDSRRIGGILEHFEECVIDIRAWIDFAVGSGFGKILLQGHSLGAMKAAFYCARSRDPRVKALFLVSPPDISGAVRQASGRPPEETLAKARKLAAEDPNRLMPEGSSYDPISAGTYISLHGDLSVAGMFSFSDDAPPSPILTAIRVPVRAVIGEMDEYVTKPAENGLRRLGQALKSAPDYAHRTIPGANHVYDDFEVDLATVLAEWAKAHAG